MTKTKSADPALQGVLAWNALNNRLEKPRLVMGIRPPSSTAAASARDRITDAPDPLLQPLHYVWENREIALLSLTANADRAEAIASTTARTLDAIPRAHKAVRPRAMEPLTKRADQGFLRSLYRQGLLSGLAFRLNPSCFVKRFADKGGRT